MKRNNNFACNSQIPERMKEGFIENECTQQALVFGKKDY